MNLILDMAGRKRTRKVVLKLTKQQIELAELQYWKINQESLEHTF